MVDLEISTTPQTQLASLGSSLDTFLAAPN